MHVQILRITVSKYREATLNKSLLLLYELPVVLVVPSIILVEPLEMFFRIKSIFLHVRKDEATFCSNGSFSNLWCIKKYNVSAIVALFHSYVFAFFF